MAGTLVPKYHRAPNFSINPPEAGGLLDLGSIIADEPPINDGCRVPIAQDQLFCSHQEGFTATRARLRSGEYGIVARLMGLAGVGGEAARTNGGSEEDVYSVRRVDTIYFTPSTEYVRESMAREDVKEYVEGSGYEPVYIVTGLKIATGSSVKIASVKKKGAVAEIGADLTSIGVPFEIGPKFNLERETRDEIGFDESTDFIAGIRVRKLAYKKHWLLRTRGTLTAMEFTKGATMVDDDYMGEAPGEEILDLGEADGLIAEHEIEIVDGEAVGIGWVL